MSHQRCLEEIGSSARKHCQSSCGGFQMEFERILSRSAISKMRPWSKGKSSIRHGEVDMCKEDMAYSTSTRSNILSPTDL